MRPLQMSFDWLTRSTASQAHLLLWRSQRQRTHFSGFPQLVDGYHLKQLCAFLPTQGSHIPPSSTSSLSSFLRNFPLFFVLSIHVVLPSFSSFCHEHFLTFPLRNSSEITVLRKLLLRNYRSRAQRFRQCKTFLIYVTAQRNYSRTLHPLALYAVA